MLRRNFIRAAIAAALAPLGLWARRRKRLQVVNSFKFPVHDGQRAMVQFYAAKNEWHIIATEA